MKNSQHAEYIEKLRDDFEKAVKVMIMEGIQKRKATGVDNELCREVGQHLNHCHEKCKNFSGRKDILNVSFLKKI